MKADQAQRPEAGQSATDRQGRDEQPLRPVARFFAKFASEYLLQFLVALALAATGAWLAFQFGISIK